MPKWAPQYIQTHGDDADIYRQRGRRESGPHGPIDIVKLQSSSSKFMGAKLFGGGAHGAGNDAAENEAPVHALKVAEGAHSS